MSKRRKLQQTPDLAVYSNDGVVDNLLSTDATKALSANQGSVIQAALDLKAPLASPSLSGVPTAPTANAGTNTTQLATTAFVQTAVSGLVDTAPETLDTLNELAAALGDDPNFATTVSSQIGAKLDSSAYTASDVLTKIKTVDGAASGLDADLLDGQHANAFAAASHSHAISDVTGLQTALDGKVDKITGKGLSTEDYTTAEKSKLAGIESGAQVNVATNLSLGTRTTTAVPVNSSTGTNVSLPAATTSLAGVMTSADKTKLDGIAAGAQVNVGTNLGSSGTGGTRTITSSTGTNTSITYTAADIGAPSTTGTGASGTWGISVTGNAGTATKLATARTISLAGDVTGSTSFDGSGNVSITATVADDSHNHVISNVDGLQSALDAKVDDSQLNTAATANSVAQRDSTGQITATNLITADKIIHSGDTNTAFRFPAADTVTVETAGAERLRVTSAGNMGIGISSPISRLHVLDTATPLQIRIGDINAGPLSPLVRFTGKNAANTTNRYADIKLNADNGVFTLMAPSSTSGPSIDALNITSSGSVGIGTSSPIGKVTSSEGFTATGIATPSNTNVDSIQVGHNGTDGVVRTWNTTGLRLESYEPIKFNVNSAERMRITPSGNLAIGVTVADYRLDLFTPNADLMRLYHADGTYNRRLQIKSTTTGAESGITFDGTSSTGGDNFTFRLQNSDRMRITNTGAFERFSALWEGGPASYSAGQATTQTQVSTNDRHAILGWKDMGRVSTRAFMEYVDIKTNIYSDNIMFAFYFMGYQYGVGFSHYYGAGYTYEGGVVTKMLGAGYKVVGNQYVHELYRASDGALCVKLYLANQSYTEGVTHVFFHSFSADVTRDCEIIGSTVYNSSSNYY